MYRQAYLELRELMAQNPELAEKVASEIMGGIEKEASAVPTFTEVMEKVATMFPEEVALLQKIAFNFADAMHAQGLSQEELTKKLDGVAFKNDPVGAVGKNVGEAAQAVGEAGKNVGGKISDAVLGAGDTLKEVAGGGIDWMKANPGKSVLIGGGAAGAGIGAVALLNAIANSKDEKVASIWNAFIEKKASAENPNIGDRLIGNVKFEDGEKNLMDDHGYAALANILMSTGMGAVAKGDMRKLQAMSALPMVANVSRGAMTAGVNDTPYGLGDAAMNAFFPTLSTGETRAKKHLREEEVAALRAERRAEKEASFTINEILKFAEFKPVITRNNPEFLEAGGLSMEDYANEYAKPMITKALMGVGVGASAGMGTAALLKGKQGLGTGAAIGGLTGLLAGELAGTPDAFRAVKADNAAIRQMIMNRLPEEELASMSEKDMDSLVRKAHWLGLYPDKA